MQTFIPTTATATAYKELADKTVAAMHADCKATGDEYNAVATGRYYNDSTGATWVQVKDRDEQDHILWITTGRFDITRGYFKAAGVESLDDIAELEG